MKKMLLIFKLLTMVISLDESQQEVWREVQNISY